MSSCEDVRVKLLCLLCTFQLSIISLLLRYLDGVRRPAAGPEAVQLIS